MELTYHVFYRPKGQKGSQLSSLAATNAAGGFASGGFVRQLWEDMKNSLYKGGVMRHPDTGGELEFAALMFGGYVAGGNATGGQLCQKWSAGHPVEIVMEPEPNLYGPDAIRARLAADVPEQPAPPEHPFGDVMQIPVPDFDAEEESPDTPTTTEDELSPEAVSVHEKRKRKKTVK